jgi:hypothetical protein
MKSPTQQLYNTLLSQNELLATMLVCQKAIREAVTQKNWESLESSMVTMNDLAAQFAVLEESREELCGYFNPENPNDMYAVSSKLSPVFKKPVIEIFHQVRQKLAVSKIENDSINEYIRITKDFLQGVFDNVIPQRRNTLYSRTGAILKSQPESLVLNTYL